MSSRIAAPRVLNIEDLRREARRRLPRMVFDYIDGGAERETTLDANARAFDEILLRPRSAVATPTCDLSVHVLGTRLALPIILAPVGSSRLFFPRGELHAARAAGDAGTIYTLSTLGGTRLEEVRAATSGTAWYQLYLVGGRDVAMGAIARAKAAGFAALMVTIDTPVAGCRERDLRNGGPQLLARDATSLPYAGQMLARPGWLIDFLRDGGLMSFPNVMLPSGPMPYADVGTALAASVVTWQDFRWIRDAWGGPIVVKGVHTGDDARHALDAGADLLVVSNHGGRQLDGVAPTIRVLPEVLRAVGGRADVLVDGGVRRGSDVVRALCLGAKAVLVGRAYAYGLAAAGQAGVARAIEILRTELVRTMTLLGCPSVGDLDRSYVTVPAAWDAEALR